MKILIFIVLNSVVTQTVALETETIYRPPTLDELVGIEIARFDVRNGKDGEFFYFILQNMYLPTYLLLRPVHYMYRLIDMISS